MWYKRIVKFDKRLLLLIPLILVPLIIFRSNLVQKLELKFNKPAPAQFDSRPPQTSEMNGKTIIKYPQDYTIVMLGDSMTEKLGNADELLGYLKKYYPNKSFQILNYGYGSTNILSAQERLEKETLHGREFAPILNIAFDLILIESFGHNPLSEYPLPEGLQRQTAALDKITSSIKESNPKAKIIFVATIAPNKAKYGMGQVDLDSSTRAKWASERMTYIENHIKYAKNHKIPLINIYQDSLSGPDGGNLDYISNTDYIHPSPTGVYFISEEIAKYLFENGILAK